jgi:hypothetical protein
MRSRSHLPSDRELRGVFSFRPATSPGADWLAAPGRTSNSLVVASSAGGMPGFRYFRPGARHAAVARGNTAIARVRRSPAPGACRGGSVRLALRRPAATFRRDCLERRVFLRACSAMRRRAGAFLPAPAGCAFGFVNGDRRHAAERNRRLDTERRRRVADVLGRSMGDDANRRMVSCGRPAGA